MAFQNAFGSRPGGNAGGLSAMEEAQIASMKQEIEGVTDMFNKMRDQCYEKCVARYSESELTVGEATCIDRCVFKFMEAHQRIGQKLFAQQQGAAAAAAGAPPQ